MCALLVYTAQAPGCSAGELSKAGPGFVHFPGLSCSGWGLGYQVLGEHTLPRWAVHLITSPVPGAQFPGCAARTPSQVWPVSPLGSWSLAATFLADVYHPGSQEDLVSNWDPAQFGGGCCLWGWDCPSPSSSGCCLPASLPLVGDGLVCSWLALLWYLLNPLFCEQAWVRRLCLRLELFTGKFSLSLFFFFFFPSLWLSHSLCCCLMLAPSDCPQGIQAQSLPWACNPHLSVQPPLAGGGCEHLGYFSTGSCD